MPALGYAYDALGNIETVTSGGNTKNAYTYDAQSQLTAETIYNYKGGTLYGTYTYDTYGNIRSISSSLSGVAGESYTLEYGDASWKDRLTRVTYTKNGSTTSGTINYDQTGNPLTYFNGQKMWNFTWKFGRQLTNASGGSDVVSYTYDVDGIRQSKTVNGSTTEYTTLDGKVVRETWGNITTDYFYDNEGKPYKIEISGNAMNCVGYYVLNQQGDVIAILDDAGNVAVTYEYNAWGKILDETGSGTLVSLYLQSYNHLKYRGYYHDTETGFYYLNSRYYDPVIGRFINADGYISTGQGFLGYNMYAYCDNNPVIKIDSMGEVPVLAIAAIIAAGGIIGGLLGAFSSAATGGDVLEGAVEGTLLGFVGSACGLFSIPPIVAGVVGCVIDMGVQLTSHHLKYNNWDSFEYDAARSGKMAVQTVISVAVPVFGGGQNNWIDAFGTALIWVESSTWITIMDVVATNVDAAIKPKSSGTSPKTNTSPKTECRIKTTISEYYLEEYNKYSK